MRTTVKLVIKAWPVGVFLILVVLWNVKLPQQIALASSVTPIVIPGSNNDGKSCANVLPGSVEFKIDGADLTNGPHSDGVMTITISNRSFTQPHGFDFSSDVPVQAIVLKDGVDGANLYEYVHPAGVTSDTGLTTPFNGDKGISHIYVCYDEQDPPTPTDTPTNTSTSTPTATGTNTPTDTATPTATGTNTPTSTPTATATATSTFVPTVPPPPLPKAMLLELCKTGPGLLTLSLENQAQPGAVDAHFVISLNNGTPVTVTVAAGDSKIVNIAAPEDQDFFLKVTAENYEEEFQGHLDCEEPPPAPQCIKLNGIPLTVPAGGVTATVDVTTNNATQLQLIRLADNAVVSGPIPTSGSGVGAVTTFQVTFRFPPSGTGSEDYVLQVGAPPQFPLGPKNACTTAGPTNMPDETEPGQQRLFLPVVTR